MMGIVSSCSKRSGATLRRLESVLHGISSFVSEFRRSNPPWSGGAQASRGPPFS